MNLNDTILYFRVLANKLLFPIKLFLPDSNVEHVITDVMNSASQNRLSSRVSWSSNSQMLQSCTKSLFHSFTFDFAGYSDLFNRGSTQMNSLQCSGYNEFIYSYYWLQQCRSLTVQDRQAFCLAGR